MTFRIHGLDPAPFLPLYGLPDDELAARGVTRQVVDATPGFPDRIELRDLAVGERALLLNYVHQPADTPYRASHAIFVREGATVAAQHVGVVPEVMRRRPLSLRAFDAAGMMTHAMLVDGSEATAAIVRMLEPAEVAYLHAHYAVRGCFAARVERA